MEERLQFLSLGAPRRGLKKPDCLEPPSITATFYNRPL